MGGGVVAGSGIGSGFIIGLGLAAFFFLAFIFRLTVLRAFFFALFLDLRLTGKQWHRPIVEAGTVIKLA